MPERWRTVSYTTLTDTTLRNRLAEARTTRQRGDRLPAQ
jgi:hypothetical protein